MADCPLADDCPSFSERISGMGCQHYGDRGGKEWCNHYNQPIEDLKTQPVKPSEEIVIDVVDMHESGAGVGRTEDGFIVLVDGVLPEARARVEVTQVHSNHARAEKLELLPMDEDDADDDAEDDADDAEAEADAADDASTDTTDGSNARAKRERLGSRENFWGS
ncbi:TRAM domain-containing protein [Natronococcus occultus]|uniref:SAM-dependent methyltransferase, tRNA(Uracil-5)-methyltransferase n=1 Tax=Natronococcus occultus SP4 TaxID=694430 RepID=L0K2C4_9EURY|nr:TRAM domain-containing protein [Natronococcus occultus]AGB38248.1 SAM-dependent methyltransferase, tRNA(uracil-5)-methyltransferase [Natronococcus occultus SP4]